MLLDHIEIDYIDFFILNGLNFSKQILAVNSGHILLWSRLA